jgi:hypothetical protein
MNEHGYQPGKKILTAANLKQVVISYSHDLFSSAHGHCLVMRGAIGPGNATDLFTMMALSSMMQFAPMTMGPAMAKMVALGCITVPEHRAV